MPLPCFSLEGLWFWIHTLAGLCWGFFFSYHGKNIICGNHISCGYVPKHIQHLPSNLQERIITIEMRNNKGLSATTSYWKLLVQAMGVELGILEDVHSEDRAAPCHKDALWVWLHPSVDGARWAVCNCLSPAVSHGAGGEALRWKPAVRRTWHNSNFHSSLYISLLWLEFYQGDKRGSCWAPSQMNAWGSRHRAPATDRTQHRIS